MRSAQRAAVRGLHRWVAPRKALVSFFADYGPKGCRGEQREAGIQWIQPPKAVSDPEFRQTTSGAHGSAGRADCLPRGKPPACMTRDNSAARNSLLIGPDAPTPAREKGLQPYGALYCFEWRSEGVQGASGKPPACINKRQLCRKKFPLVGIDAPTPAREKGLQPYGALDCFEWRSEGGAGGRAESPPACSDN